MNEFENISSQEVDEQSLDENIVEAQAKPTKCKGQIVSTVIRSVALVLAGAVAALLFVPNTLNQGLTGNKTQAKLAAVIDLVNREYVDAGELDEEVLADMAAYGYIYALGDPYSAYITKDEYEEIISANEGVSYGIGITVFYNEESGGMKVVRVSVASPADKAGIKEGDIITAVENKAVTKENYAESVGNIRGEDGTDVLLTVLSGKEEKKLAVTRGEFVSTSVYSHMIGDVAYIEILTFNTATVAQFKEAVNNAVAHGATALVFDLRNNTGGLIGAANDMLDMLLPKGEIGYAVYNGNNRVSLASSDKKEIDLPMAVLTNGETASASEYFASALRDYNKAILVGAQTFGKGVMQSTVGLSDGSAVRLTVAKIYTKSGKEIHGIGLSPDVEVPQADSEVNYMLLTENEDIVLQTALDELNSKSGK